LLILVPLAPITPSIIAVVQSSRAKKIGGAGRKTKAARIIGIILICFFGLYIFGTAQYVIRCLFG
jgi:hypothetical protein